MAEEQTTEYSPEIVERAKSMGHIPLEEFKGDPERWVPPDKYIERAENLMPILKSQLSRFETEIGTIKSENQTLKQALESQRATTKKIVEMGKTVGEQAYERAKKDIQAKQAKAVADGDVNTWQQLEDQKDKLQKPEPIAMDDPPVQQNPAFENWESANDWYGKDPDATFFADKYGETLQQQNPTMAYQDILSAVETKVKEAFPSKFTNPNREQATTVEETSQRTQTTHTGKKTYNNLPADAKAQCDVFVNEGIITREKYVEDYFGLESEQQAKREAILGRM